MSNGIVECSVDLWALLKLWKRLGWWVQMGKILTSICHWPQPNGQRPVVISIIHCFPAWIDVFHTSTLVGVTVISAFVTVAIVLEVVKKDFARSKGKKFKCSLKPNRAQTYIE